VVQKVIVGLAVVEVLHKMEEQLHQAKLGMVVMVQILTLLGLLRFQLVVVLLME
jgi:hypothetical protein